MIRARSLVRGVPWLERLYQGARQRWAMNVTREFAIARYVGDRPWALATDPMVAAPIITAADVDDVPAEFVADPFVLRRGGDWQLFFEVLRADTQRGVIAAATSLDGVTWRYLGVVLAEPFHLSYPFVFEWEDAVYMIPESLGTNSVRLYRALAYPLQWEYVGDMVQGEDYADSTVFHRDGCWWMFTETGSRSTTGEREGHHDVLRLFLSPGLEGPWREHPASPVVDRDPRVARMAGRVLEHDGRLVRFAQDCSQVYGRQVFAFEIVTLTKERYLERPLGDGPVLGPGRARWNSGGMHHVDAVAVDGAWVGFVDGWRWVTAPRCASRLLAALGVTGGRRR